MERKGIQIMQQISLFDYVIQLLEMSDRLLFEIQQNIDVLLRITNSTAIPLSSFLFFFRNIERFEFIGCGPLLAFEEEADTSDDILGV